MAKQNHHVENKRVLVQFYLETRIKEIPFVENIHPYGGRFYSK